MILRALFRRHMRTGVGWLGPRGHLVYTPAHHVSRGVLSSEYAGRGQPAGVSHRGGELTVSGTSTSAVAGRGAWRRQNRQSKDAIWDSHYREGALAVRGGFRQVTSQWTVPQIADDLKQAAYTQTRDNGQREPCVSE
jgi:hypothetical protein